MLLSKNKCICGVFSLEVLVKVYQKLPKAHSKSGERCSSWCVYKMLRVAGTACHPE